MDVVESDRQVAPPGVHLISILLCLLSLEIKLDSLKRGLAMGLATFFVQKVASPMGLATSLKS